MVEDPVPERNALMPGRHDRGFAKATRGKTGLSAEPPHRIFLQARLLRPFELWPPQKLGFSIQSTVSHWE